MSKVYKTKSNLMKVWNKLDSAYEDMEDVVELLEGMSGLPAELEKELHQFDLSSINSLKQHVEMMVMQPVYKE